MLVNSPLVSDFIVAAIAAVPILLAIKVTERLGSDYCWVNRKIIHFSTIPAVYAYLYIFNEVYVWTIASLAFSLCTLLPHLKNREMDWFQIRGNFGEVYYCFMYLVVGSAFFYVNRPLAATAMLLTAVGDGVTGIVRFFLFKRREVAISSYASTDPSVRKACKTLAGTIAYLVVSIPLAIALLGLFEGSVIAVVSAIAEKQHLLDDNLAIPATVLALYYALTSFVV